MPIQAQMQLHPPGHDPAFTVAAYFTYLAMSVLVTIWVAKTLHANGRAFLVDAFHGNEELADLVNHLLVVGFYLINIGYVSLALRYGSKPHDLQTAIEFFSTKFGWVLLVLGAMHFLNLRIFSSMRRRALLLDEPPPVPPSGRVPARG